MSNHSVGHQAEIKAAKFINSQGFKVVSVNWVGINYEIDIVAKKNNKLYFIEVKYRQNLDYGSGFDYITDQKLKRMKYAAESWVLENGWKKDYFLGALELTGPDFEVTGFLPSLD